MVILIYTGIVTGTSLFFSEFCERVTPFYPQLQCVYDNNIFVVSHKLYDGSQAGMGGGATHNVFFKIYCSIVLCYIYYYLECSLVNSLLKYVILCLLVQGC